MSVTRKRIRVQGIVQGVGFRPFIYRIALEHGIGGWVRNTAGNVEIAAEGPEAAVAAFERDVVARKPALAWIRDLSGEGEPVEGADEFIILESRDDPGGYQPISPDIATCPDCRDELLNPSDRRYGYAFTNCTNCGPRLTIIRDIPYDRPFTTMAPFPMCPDCQAEYEAPLDRRFHAQPNACPVCGPSLSVPGETDAEDPLELAIETIRSGGILALKGLGGFHLACDATSAAAVSLLRERKRRRGKPLAVMMPDLETAAQHCDLTDQERDVLTSPQSPIVLAPWRREISNIVTAVAPGLGFLGVMLPYTPLHILLMDRLGTPLVMTSGNLSEEPIAKDNDEALRRLGSIADRFLVHDREILARCDDSVYWVDDRPRPIRRARGHAPQPLLLTEETRPILAAGAQEKNTFCLARGNQAFVSPHIGDMENQETLDHFQEMVRHYEHIFRTRAEALACDLHPEYLSSKWAREQAQREGLPLVECQHHHAHVVSCMVDNGVTDTVIGVSLDGTGYGTDGHIWGGEFLTGSFREFARFAHLEYVPMPGGSAAIKKPARMAAAYLLHLLDGPFLRDALGLVGLPAAELDIVRQQLERKLNTPLTSSMGRLFDGVSSLLGLCHQADYEGQAAIFLEMQAHKAPDEEGNYPLLLDSGPDGWEIRLEDILRMVVQERWAGTAVPIVARRFHNTIAHMIELACNKADPGLKTVALTGGVFQNRLLCRLARQRLTAAGYHVLEHRQIPCNDGGISVGQALIAHHRLAEGGQER